MTTINVVPRVNNNPFYNLTIDYKTPWSCFDEEPTKLIERSWFKEQGLKFQLWSIKREVSRGLTPDAEALAKTVQKAANLQNPMFLIELLALRLNNQPIVKIDDLYHGMSLLDIAAKNGDVDAAFNLIQIDPRLVNKRDDQDRSALYYACHYGHLDVVTMLLENGASTCFTESTGDPLLAVISGCVAGDAKGFSPFRIIVELLAHSETDLLDLFDAVSDLAQRANTQGLIDEQDMLIEIKDVLSQLMRFYPAYQESKKFTFLRGLETPGSSLHDAFASQYNLFDQNVVKMIASFADMDLPADFRWAGDTDDEKELSH